MILMKHRGDRDKRSLSVIDSAVLTRIDDVGTELQYEQEENLSIYRWIPSELPPLTLLHQEHDGVSDIVLATRFHMIEYGTASAEK